MPNLLPRYCVINLAAVFRTLPRYCVINLAAVCRTLPRYCVKKPAELPLCHIGVRYFTCYCNLNSESLFAGIYQWYTATDVTFQYNWIDLDRDVCMCVKARFADGENGYFFLYSGAQVESRDELVCEPTHGIQWILEVCFFYDVTTNLHHDGICPVPQVSNLFPPIYSPVHNAW